MRPLDQVLPDEVLLYLLHPLVPSCASRQVVISREQICSGRHTLALSTCTNPPPAGSEDQTPAHLQHRLTGLASQIKNFATVATKQILASEQSLSVRFSFSGGAPAHPLGVVPEIRADCVQSARIFFFVPCYLFQI